LQETPLSGPVYQPVPGFEDHLEEELRAGQPGSGGGPPFERWGPLYSRAGADTPVFWQQNTWLRPFRLEFDSISEAAAFLRGIQRNWAPVLHRCFRRGALIEARLPPLSRKKRPFPWLLPESPVGAWTLLDEHTLIASAACSSPFPGGIGEFAEDRDPPSRAYLKLWESLVRCRKWPRPGERCLDAGASPGGWSWALVNLGARVTAVDRAPLEEKLLALSGADGTAALSYLKHDAFTLNPGDLGPMDWVFCDVICYPARLYEWIEKWLDSGLCGNFICTIKMQGRYGSGEDDWEIPRRLAAIPGSRVVHLYHNKHELTWMKLGEPAGAAQSPVEAGPVEATSWGAM
jgi:23S rRNA (cytidine2498-2'-O)-methyltransferase